MNPPSLSSLTLALFWCQPALTQHVVTHWVDIMSPLKDMPTWHTCWSLWQEGVSCSSWRCGSDDHFLPLSVQICSDDIIANFTSRVFLRVATTWPPSLTPWLCAPACCSEILHHPWELRYPILIIVPWRQLTRSFVTIHPIGSHSGSKVSTEIFFYIGHFVCFFFVCFSVVLFFQFQHQCEHHCPPWSIVGNVAPKEKTGSQRQAVRTIQ